MLPILLPIGAILLGIGLLLLGSGLLNTLLVLKASIEGYSDGLIGLIMSGYFAGFIVGTFLALPVIRRVGHIRAFALCAAIMACSAVLHVLIINPAVWLVLRVVTGTVLVIMYTVIESWLNGQADASQRGKVFAIYMMVNLSALALGQQLLRVDSPENFVLFSIAGMLITISLVPVTWTRFAQPQVAEVKRLRFHRLFQIAPVAAVGALLSGLVMGAFWGVGPLFAERSGLDTEKVGLFMSCAIIGGAVFQLPLGRYSDRNDRRKVLGFVCTGGIFAAVLLSLSSGHWYWQLPAVALYGGMAFCLYPVVVAHLIDHLDPQDILAGVSGLLLLHGAGAAIGPALAGHIMDTFGYISLPVYFIVFLLILAAYSFYQIHHPEKAQDEPEQPIQFVPMVRTTPTAIEMMPEEPVAAMEENASAFDTTNAETEAEAEAEAEAEDINTSGYTDKNSSEHAAVNGIDELTHGGQSENANTLNVEETHQLNQGKTD